MWIKVCFNNLMINLMIFVKCVKDLNNLYWFDCVGNLQCCIVFKKMGAVAI